MALSRVLSKPVGGLAFFGVLVLAAATGLPGSALAATDCAALKRALSRPVTSVANSTYGRYAELADRQAAELQFAERQSQQGRCETGNPDPRCGALMPTLRKMRKNLAYLEERRDRAATGNARLTRADLEAAYFRAGCDRQDRGIETAETLTTPAPGLRSTAKIINVATTPPDQMDASEVQGTRVDLSYFGGGAYRTICVRMCDGYFFPLSFSTTRSGFAGDANLCHQKGSQYHLFAYRNPGEDPADAISVANGETYRSLPHAFAYQSERAPACETGETATDAKPFQDNSRSSVAPELTPGFEEPPKLRSTS
ncbi:hypothetical protein HDIA_2604 [Hartmannibacter diazotrophicus]|uniref:Uncharacterized protein n=1 Tax=Hartmannibacter diazotrophicus TaxID=1482074 RepID=A0A2C9D997_9HYPH|nr:DUF2865 domain-containing protein [Hartmannibacter diazotrophicus]SON56145.1 hypothetical protein HDIA_2604 [Hartmannibacter diazotrophicus]